MRYTRPMKSFARLIVFLAVCGGIGWGVWVWHGQEAKGVAVAAPGLSAYTRFDLDVFDIVKENYWQATTDADLSVLFLQSAQKATNDQGLKLATSTRAGVADLLEQVFSATSTVAERTDRSRLIAQIVLYNLAPQGRSALMSSQAQKELRDTVANVPAKDLYQTLGTEKGASAADVQRAYAAEVKKLGQATSSEAQAQKQQLSHAKEILTDPIDKSLYDQTGMQPTVFMRVVGGNTLYIDMSQVSPASFAEFVKKLQDTVGKNPKLSYMILDVRHNIGGALDFLTYFMGLFFGPNQFAFDLYHKGELKPQRTPAVAKMPELAQFKETAILADGQTQSTAELMTATFKRFHMAHVVGVKTHGWGTVENTFPIPTVLEASTTYAVYLVHSLTAREDNQPIEGMGVDPDVDVSTSGWKTKLSSVFDSPSFIQAIIKEETAK